MGPVHMKEYYQFIQITYEERKRLKKKEKEKEKEKKKNTVQNKIQRYGDKQIINMHISNEIALRFIFGAGL